ncbi:germ cell nuclear acidic protein-like [Engystomops pustulosus]|uniref:germ cell nuclear acidic protein-like n=1 Tax=Engystomops pustulosus TaxID=76066 RepID=UPI003AFA12C1
MKEEVPRGHQLHYGFLKDLSSPTSKYVTDFHQNKQELARRLYRFFNQSVFDNQLPADMEISWNKRLRRQAGRTGFGKKNGVPYAVIHISDKICDSADRLRDTLIHEMCHAACWLIDGEADLTHGLLWDYHCAMYNVLVTTAACCTTSFTSQT